MYRYEGQSKEDISWCGSSKGTVGRRLQINKELNKRTYWDVSFIWGVTGVSKSDGTVSLR